jgi:hypothetical protein
MQTVSASAHQLVTGLAQVKAEVKTMKALPSISSEDRFIKVLEVPDHSIMSFVHR